MLIVVAKVVEVVVVVVVVVIIVVVVVVVGIVGVDGGIVLMFILLSRTETTCPAGAGENTSKLFGIT